MFSLANYGWDVGDAKMHLNFRFQTSFLSKFQKENFPHLQLLEFLILKNKA